MHLLVHLDYLKITNLSAPAAIPEAGLLLEHDPLRSERNSILQVDLEDLQHHLLEMRLVLRLANHLLPNQQALINLASMAIILQERLRQLPGQIGQKDQVGVLLEEEVAVVEEEEAVLAMQAVHLLHPFL